MPTSRVVRSLCLLVTAGVLALPSMPAAQTGVRTISSFTYLDYAATGISRIYENTTVVPVATGSSVVMKLYRDERTTWHNDIYTLGYVHVLATGVYTELSYGYGRTSRGGRADYFTVDTIRETGRSLMGAGVRHAAYDGYAFTSLSPYARYRIIPSVAVWAKYFATLDTDDNLDHSLWMDVEAGPFHRVSLRPGFTVGSRLSSPEYEASLGGKAAMSFYSLFIQASYQINDHIAARYHFENLSREQNQTDKKHTLILDIRL